MSSCERNKNTENQNPQAPGPTGACSPMPDSLHNLQAAIAGFADERDWKQFHNPKNLAMALIVEAAELVEHFQWLNQQQSLEIDAELRRKVSLEMADVLIYLVRLAEQLDIDLLRATEEKMAINAEKYPAGHCRGKADKYTRYTENT